MDVGFSLQADAVSGSSLLFNASGRLLKALSDGGVDAYAVGAASWLGKTIPINVRHESSIHTMLVSRGGRTGLLVKAMRIGWGHSDIAVELARTRAGTASLLTIGALATGSSYYEAANGLAKLLVLSGFRSDQLPNIDSLRNFVAYIGPIMAETGFAKVFAQINITISRACAKRRFEIPAAILANGEPFAWAGAVRQLILTAERTEHLSMNANQRVAWLAAWASHVLDMAVRIQLYETVVWECAGTRGSVHFLNPNIYALPSMARDPDLRIINAPSTATGAADMDVAYPISEALSVELSTFADDSLDTNEVYRETVRIALKMRHELRLQSPYGHPYKIGGSFPKAADALQQSLIDLGIPEDIVRSNSDYRTNWKLNTFDDITYDLIIGVASSAVALMQCVYDAKETKVNPDVIGGRCRTKWLQFADHRSARKEETLRRQAPSKNKDLVNGPNKSIDDSCLFLHLSKLLHGRQAIESSELEGRHNYHNRTLAVSASNITIYYRALMDDLCFDSQGRVLAIESGRLSVDNVLRKFVAELGDNISEESALVSRLDNATSLATGFGFEPHYAPSNARIEMKHRVMESRVLLNTKLQFGASGLLANLQIIPCIEAVLNCIVPPACTHGPTKNFIASSENQAWIAPFGFKIPSIWRGSIFYALKGSQLQQIFQCGMLGKRLEGRCALQMDSCLDCTLAALKELLSCDGKDPETDTLVIIMAG